jgi:NAD(P)H-quinone oxidoreductase subunit 5
MSGFFSKDEIIGASAVSHPIITAILIFTSGLTAFYMFRCYFLTFSNEYRGEAHIHREIPWKWQTLTAPLVVLMIPAIFSGLLGFAPGAWTHGPEASWESPFGMFVHWDHMKPEAVNLMIVITTVVVSFAGWGLAAAAYWKRSTNFHTGIANAMPWAYQFSLNRWYWDSLYLKSAQFFLYGGLAIWTLVDKFIVDNIVNATAVVTKGGGGYLRYTETGRGQYYALVIFGCVAAISLFVYFTRPGS